MPNLNPQASTLRAGNYHYTGYVVTVPYEVVITGTVTATPTFPALTVAYTLDTGGETDVQTDMLVVFYDSTGRMKGQTRVRQATVTSTSLPIGETSAGTINIVSGDTFTVYDAILLFDKLVSNTVQLNKDSAILLSDNTSNPPPVANAGGPWAGFTDAGQVYATVPFSGADSFTVDPDSSGTKSYLWDVDDGTITVGTTTTEDIEVEFPIGFRHVTLIVTDSSNSKSHTRYIPVWVCDPDNPPLPVIARQLSADVQNGWSFEFEVPSDTGATLEDIPDGSMVVYFERETYNGTEGSYGSSVDGRSHIKFVGYLERDNTEIDAENDTLVFFAASPLAILDTVPALPQYIANKAVPNQWRFVKSLTINRILWYLAYWHSSLMTYFDFLWIDGTDLSYREIAVKTTNSITAQLRDVAQSINCDVTCDRLGRVRIIRSPNQLTTAERAARTTTYDFTLADMLTVSYEREHRGEVKQVTAGGITGSLTKAGTQAVFSKAPGVAPAWFGTGATDKTDYIVSSQADINRIAGLLFAEANGLYYGQFVPQEVTLTIPDGYDVFDPANREFETLLLPASTNKRGISFDVTEHWVLNRLSISYAPDTGGKDITHTISHETFGPDGVTEIRKQPAQNGLPPFQPLDFAFPSFPVYEYPSTIPVAGADTLAVMDITNNRFMRTDNFNTPSISGGPTYTAIPITGTINGSWLDWVGIAGTSGAGWLVTTTNIYRIADLFGTATATSQFTFSTAVTGPARRRTIQGTRTNPNFAAVASYYGASGGITVTTTTDGTNWTEVTVDADYNTNSTGISEVEPTIYVSEHVPGTLYAGAFITTDAGVDADARLYKSSDSGATWGVDTGRMTTAARVGSALYFPYQGNATDSIFYWTDLSSGAFVMNRTTGTTQTPIDPNPTAFTSGFGINGLSASDDNRLRLMVCYGRLSGIFGSFGLAVSIDAGTTWMNRLPETTTVQRWFKCFLVNDNNAYLLGDGAEYIGYTWDFGVTIDGRTGNLPAANYVKVIGP